MPVVVISYIDAEQVFSQKVEQQSMRSACILRRRVVRTCEARLRLLFPLQSLASATFGGFARCTGTDDFRMLSERPMEFR